MTLFRFPEDESQRDAWVRAIKRENWTPSEQSRLCQLHFISGRPSRFPNNPDYVPTRFTFRSTSAILEKSNTDRYERLQARRRKQSQYRHFEHQEQGEKKRKADSQIQQVPGDVANLCTGEPSYYVELPSDNVELPADNVGLLADDVELPAGSVGLQIPDNDVELSANDVELPVDNVGLQIPDDDVALPNDNVELLGHDVIVELLEIVEEKEKLERVLSNTAKDLRKANEKITILEECLKSANEAAKMSDAKYEEVVEKLRKSKEEKISLMRQKYQTSSIAMKIQNDDKKTHLFTGLPSYGVFSVLVTHLTPLAAKEKSLGSGLNLADELLVTLLKISQALTNELIGSIFDIHETKVSKIFHRWINVMFQGLQPLVVWPDKGAIITHMPSCFKPRYAKAVCIIDCSEVFIQRPTCLTARAQTYSNYKSHNTVKFLVAITPTGAVSFISKCWGGRVSDRHLTVNSGFLRRLNYGDLILADRGFDIVDDLAMFGASLAIPPFTKGKPQLSQREVEFSRQLSNVRIHVERAIGRMKYYKILHATLPISLIKRDHETDFATIDKIVFVCAALCNLQPPLIV